MEEEDSEVIVNEEDLTEVLDLDDSRPPDEGKGVPLEIANYA